MLNVSDQTELAFAAAQKCDAAKNKMSREHGAKNIV
jgi:hypothetical protein